MPSFFRPVRFLSVIAILADPASESLVRRVGRTLDREELGHVTVTSTANLPADTKILIVPNAVSLPRPDVDRLNAFLRGGGKLILYYCAEPSFARAFGLTAGTWRGDRSHLAIAPADPSFAPYPHRTDNIIAPRPSLTGEAKTDARFLTAGSRTAGPAVMLNPKVGAWFSHIPPLPTPAAAKHLASIVERLLPQAGEEAKKRRAEAAGAAESGEEPKSRRAEAEPVALALDGEAQPSPILAAWMPAAPGFPGGVAALPDWMKARGLNAVFAYPEALGTAPQRAKALAAAKAHGIAIHAWMNAFAATADHNWTVPRTAAERAARVRALLASVPDGVAGVQLDYVRAPEGASATPELTEAVSAFVRDFTRAFRAARPGTALSAAVFPTPDSSAARAQDWPRWIREGWLDFVSPMIYTEDAAAFAASLAQGLAAVPADRLVPGIASCADEAAVDRDGARAQIAAARGARCRGVSFFALDWALADLLKEDNP